jgi:osmotically inducible protein OsmC
MPTRKSTAEWKGGLKGGAGTFRGESGKIQGDYSFGTRFENVPGTNPEELLAAAQASCYSMALALALEQDGTPAETVRTEARCTIDKQGDGFTITTMQLRVRARAPGADEDRFLELAEATKVGCPVSKTMLGNVEMELDASLEQTAPTG